jgi:hypothetical protein
MDPIDRTKMLIEQAEILLKSHKAELKLDPDNFHIRVNIKTYEYQIKELKNELKQSRQTRIDVPVNAHH